MKKLLHATATCALIAGSTWAANAEDVKIGILLGFTGPLETIMPHMAASAEMAMKEAEASGKFMGGSKIIPVRADSTCIDASVAQTAAERLITSDKVSAIIGADCTGVTIAVLQNVTRPNGIGMISPSATSPALSTIQDDGLFFRTSPSDARQGEIMADVITERGIKSVAISYDNNDYGKGLAESFQKAFEAKGGKITISAAHEDGKADYSSEVAALAAAGGDLLVVLGYVDQGGKGIVQGSLDSGAFSKFYFPDGMFGESLLAALGTQLEGSFGDVPGNNITDKKFFDETAKKAGFDGGSTFTGETYDATALIILAMAAANSANSKEWTAKVTDIANAPGEPIQFNELGKALELIAAGKDIDYVGATAVEFIGPGESAGNYRIYTIKDGAYSTDGFR